MRLKKREAWGVRGETPTFRSYRAAVAYFGEHAAIVRTFIHEEDRQ